MALLPIGGGGGGLSFGLWLRLLTTCGLILLMIRARLTAAETKTWMDSRDPDSPPPSHVLGEVQVYTWKKAWVTC